MASNGNRIEIQLPRAKRLRLEELREELSLKLGRVIPMSHIVEVVLDQFFEMSDQCEKRKR